ncbi:MAG: FtsQ-type POTRA domain-containing protein [Oscillospiraceae bacterium]|nr:FtsQ-type POTRA domain-containing protein [Oscillospiraceae bacterium]
MDQNEKTRLRERGSTTVSRERPRTPNAGPRPARPRSGNAASREAARRERSRALQQSPEEAADPRQRGGAAAPREPAPPTRRAPQKREKQQRAPASEARKKPRKGKKPHRVYNTNFGFKFAVMLAVVAVIVLSMVIFFKVKHIEVILPTDEAGQTKSYYTADEIRDASGIHVDDNLLSTGKATAASRIHAALPYVNEIQIKKQLPGTVIISFTEFEVTYGIQDEKGGWWLMSREGRILEPADEQTAKEHLCVTGMPIEEPQVGDWFKPAATEGADLSEIASKQKVVLDVIPALEGRSYVKELARVDVSTSYDLTLWYGTRYEIRLGTTENLDYKLRTLAAILENTDVQHKSGTIDLTFSEDDKAHFLEFR